MADEYGVTHETLRKELMLLESHRLLRRVHGGAMPVESLSFEPSINERTTMAAEKKRIATAAAELLPPSGAVLFDSGTTTAALAANLPRESSLVAVTNSLPIALELMVYPQLTVHMLGGQIRSGYVGYGRLVGAAPTAGHADRHRVRRYQRLLAEPRPQCTGCSRSRSQGRHGRVSAFDRATR